MESKDNIVVGSQVWFVDPEVAFVDGTVLNIKEEEAEIQTSEGKTVVTNTSKVYAKDVEAPAEGVEDMTKLSYLHEPEVLENLAIRFKMDEVYTYSGDILIAINPFQGLSHLYDSSTMERYKGAAFGELSPHVFAIADVAYRAMINERKSNSILVSGESGAGKTETTKMLMHYLAYLGGHSAAEGRTVEQKVLESNPVLEAFGNAKTVKNNNSSRFGKFVEIQFNEHGRISGAAIRTYLLERSRVCQISDHERNYHCFYLLCAAPPEEIERYKLGNPKAFHYLNQSNCYELDGTNDAQEYLATRRAMDIVGINEKEQEAIFRVVAAILHLGNIDFAKEEEDSSVVKDDESKSHLQMTSELLMCDSHALEDALCKRIMVTREEVIKRSLDPIGATVNRDGLAKTIYSRLFDWLVDKINASIGQDPKSKYLIGILDIYGFESFKSNSFEQFCINFTNEKLQQHFNQHVFKMEQNEYTKEEIDWSYIAFVDNQDILDLIEKKPGGIIALLDEACMFPKSTHETFSQKLYQTFKDHKRFIKPKLTRSDFTIVHYAGEVQYQSDQFLDKNKDYVVPEHQDLLSASKCSFVSGLFPAPTEETTKSSKFSSIGSRFKLQLQQLMDTLNSTEPHYIRCVKPNNVLKPAIFEKINVMQQLRSGGVLEAIRIKCAGYPTHKTFTEFLARFGILAPEFLKGSYEEKVACKEILDKMGLTRYQIGKTKVFLRVGQMAELDAWRTTALGESAKVIQKQIRTHLTRKCYVSMLKASVCIQSLLRRELAQKHYEDVKKGAAAVKIQKYARRKVAKESYSIVKGSAIVLQGGLRAMSARNELKCRRRIKAAVIIQAYFRCLRDSLYHKKLRKASVFTQSRWRGITTRREFGKLKLALETLVTDKKGEDKSQEQASTDTPTDQEAEDKSQEQASTVKATDEGAEDKSQEQASTTDQEVEDKSQDQPGTEVSEGKETKSGDDIQVDETNASNLKESVVAEESKERCSSNETSIPDQEDKKIETLTAEVKLEEKETEAMQTTNRGVDEGDVVQVKECTVAEESKEPCTSCEIVLPVHGDEKVDILTAEVEKLKALLQSEKQRADDSDKKCAEAWELSQKRLKKLEETERRVYQLQDSLNRLLYCMSEQFSQLKMILRSSSSSSSTSRPIIKEDQIDTSDNSDASSSDSDFTFPAPSPTSPSFTSLKPSTIQLIVQDISATDITGSETGDKNREGAFDDYF